MSRPLLLGLTAILALAAAAFLAARALPGHDATALAFDLKAPAYASSSINPGLSTSGFSGFELGTGLGGNILLAGRAVAPAANATITLATASGEASVRFTGARSLLRLEGATASALAPGATVVVIRGADKNAAASILIVQP